MDHSLITGLDQTLVGQSDLVFVDHLLQTKLVLHHMVKVSLDKAVHIVARFLLIHFFVARIVQYMILVGNF